MYRVCRRSRRTNRGLAEDDAVQHWQPCAVSAVRAINGEVRLWVNGEEVTGGTNCEPRTGYLCLESEGSPVEFRGLRIRELP